MSGTNVLPVLSLSDVEQAAQLIQQAYAPASGQVSAETQRRLQQEILEIQRRPEAWGLVVPFLEHQDPNIEFFGAHTIQVKIARDWDQFPQHRAVELRDIVLGLTIRAINAGRSKVILRKLYVSLTSLALKLVPSHPDQWPSWVLSSVTYLSENGAITEQILDFLAIIAEEIESADLLQPTRLQMRQTLLDSISAVVQGITASIAKPPHQRTPGELNSALKCLEAWMPTLPASDLTPLMPILINLLAPQQPSLEFDENVFVPASDALQAIMSESTLSDGSGSKSLTEPLLLWMHTLGGRIVDATLSTGFADAVSHSFCKLLAGLGDHSTSYLAAHLASTSQPGPLSGSPPLPTKSQLIQNYLRLLLAYTSLPGYYGVDEEESEMTLGFWYLFQEALWSVEYQFGFEEEEEDDGIDESDQREKNQWTIARAVYGELVRVLERKVKWPSREELGGWTNDQKDKFQVYRRDVGDTLINAYYILRNDMLEFYINGILERLNARRENDGWEEIEATIHCIMSIQEAVPVEDNEHLRCLFGPDILGRLPITGRYRVRRTMLSLIGTYASWFTTQRTPPPGSSQPSLLMTAVSYVANALPEPSLCLQAANALRDLCDANRIALAHHIVAFGELHVGLTGIPDTEKAKVLQSIASVIQALSPEEEIPLIETIASPVVSKLVEALQSSARLPEEARALAIQQLQTLTGVAKGLTRTTDGLVSLDDSEEEREALERMNRAREDPRMVKLREDLLNAIRGTVEIMSTDASVSDALSDLFKSITSLPADATLISLPPGPLLEFVCIASQRQLTAVWLSLASMLFPQLDPPPAITTSLVSTPSPENWVVALNVLPALLQVSLAFLSQPEAMEANPDIVQAFFSCMEAVARIFTKALYQLPGVMLDALIDCSRTALSLQERYSLVSSCTFLHTLVNRTTRSDDLEDAKSILAQKHGRLIMQALLSGLAGIAPRSASPNLIDLLSMLLSRYPAEGRAWMSDILFSDDFIASKASREAKEKFFKSIYSSRTIKRTREAAQEFVLVARGLENSSFGYSSVVV
ncbi:ARM repeat-containing protein [Neolentinus lepideus HHB14362 ss-1]|uniref:Importin-13 n=1 Tax=Neolentinus lepideus HHB14362 ss-1 TaxID=1314782 RepID=A0A165NMQ0_9AGAM|nr:ARM repeat-containing protein [Neolentinus lepideus HHB14362 ss-1]